MWNVARTKVPGRPHNAMQQASNNPTPPAIIRVNRTFSGETRWKLYPRAAVILALRPLRKRQMEKGSQGSRTWEAYDNGFVTAITPHSGCGNHIAKAVFTKKMTTIVLAGYKEPLPHNIPQAVLVPRSMVFEDTDWRKGHWIGIRGEDAVLEISLERPKAMRSISVGVLKDIRAWIALPKALEISIWYEGSSAWKTIDMLPMENPLGEEGKEESFLPMIRSARCRKYA